MLVGLQVTPRQCCKTNLWSYALILKVWEKTLINYVSQSTHLTSIVFFYPLWKLGLFFLFFFKSDKKTSVMKCVKKLFFFSRGIKKLVSWNVLRSVSSVWIVFGVWNLFESWLWENLQPFWSLFAEIFLTVPRSLFVQNFFHQGKLFVCKKLSCL